MNAVGASNSIWERMRITPPAARPKPCYALALYSIEFAAWQREWDPTAVAMRGWKNSLIAINPKLKLSKNVQAELPI